MTTQFTPVQSELQIEQTARLAREIWSEHYTPVIGSGQVEYMLTNFQSASAIAAQIRDEGYCYYLIEDGGDGDPAAVGYFAVAEKPDELFLSKLYVLKSMRGRGIARKALEFIRSMAADKKLARITLTVNKNNAASIAVYQKLGFVNAGPIVQDIGGGFVMDDYQMVRSLR